MYKVRLAKDLQNQQLKVVKYHQILYDNSKIE